MKTWNRWTLLVAMVSPLIAHHGTSVTYQVDKVMTLTGTAVEFAYVNPHPQLYFDVKDADGKIQHWGSEFAPTPLMMKNMKAGWSRTSIKAGDPVVVVCNPHRVVGSTACLMKELTVNGTKLKLGNIAAPPAAAASGYGK